MFDNPRRELEWLEEELLAAEEEEVPEEDDEEYYDEDFLSDGSHQDLEDDWLEDVEALLGPEEPDAPSRPVRRRKNPAVDFPRAVYDDEELDESAAVFDDDPPPKGIGGLVFLAILEVLGILAVVGWWLKWLN